jgi:Ser/Thr protein kinase RdoA (MazF antagonist)
MDVPALSGFLRDRSVDAATVAPLLGGEKNRSWLVESSDDRRFVARRYGTSTAAEVEYELHAVEFLAGRGFPTPAPVRTRDGALWSLLDDRPAALFDHVEGEHPTDLTAGSFSSDLPLGRAAAGLAGRMHALCAGQTFPGRRTDQRDPLRRIERFLRSSYASVPALREATDRLTSQRAKLAAVYADPAGLRRGLVHNDLTAANLLLDAASGEVTAVLDFDDCLTSFQLYDLGAIADVWGRDADLHADLTRVQELVAAYHATRPLTDREAELAVDLIATHAAATGVGVLTNLLRKGGRVQDPRDSHSMRFFLDLCGKPG